MPDDKLSEFWERVPSNTDGVIEWPDDAKEREKLAREILAAKFVGALEHVVEDALNAIEGTPPAAGTHEFLALNARAQVLSTLSVEQRDAVRDVITDLARSAAYWPLVKVSKDFSVLLDVVVSPRNADGKLLGDFPLEPDGELSWVVLASLARFSRTWPGG